MIFEIDRGLTAKIDEKPTVEIDKGLSFAAEIDKETYAADEIDKEIDAADKINDETGFATEISHAYDLYPKPVLISLMMLLFNFSPLLIDCTTSDLGHGAVFVSCNVLYKIFAIEYLLYLRIHTSCYLK